MHRLLFTWCEVSWTLSTPGTEMKPQEKCKPHVRTQTLPYPHWSADSERMRYGYLPQSSLSRVSRGNPPSEAD